MKHKVLIIGCGMMSSTYSEVLSNHEKFEVVGVKGRNYDKTRDFALKNKIPNYGTSLNELVNISGATLALVCTPNSVHYNDVIESANCGLHVMCEKPLHIDPLKQNEMITICNNNNVKLGVCYRLRFARHFRFVSEFIKSGGLGRITVIDTYIKLWRDDEYYSKSSWHGVKSIDGGGPFIQQGSHFIDLAIWYGDGYKSVLAKKLFTLHHSIEVEDHGYAVVEYSNGAVGIIQASTACKGAPVNSSRIEITGEKGSIFINAEGILHWDVEGYEKPEINDSSDIMIEQFTDFAEAIEQNREPFVNGEAAKVSTELIHDIYSEDEVIALILRSKPYKF